MISRSERIGIAEETVSISRAGRYTSAAGNEVCFDSAVDTRFWKASDLKALSLDGAVVSDSTRIQCLDEGVVDTIFRLRDEGVDMERTGVLNFASAYHPGGGFLNGSMAQEEALAYCSNLYVNQIDTPFYEENRLLRSKMYSDNMLESRVTFFRDSAYRLVERPVKTMVITSPAVNMGQVKLKGEDERLACQVMRGRMGLVLDLMICRGCTTAVLGAFGCGVFKNDPDLVAKNWLELLEEKGQYFERVIMAVLDKPGYSNYKVFRKYF